MVTIFAALVLWSCGGDRDAMRERLAYVSQCNRADTVFTEAWLPTVDSLTRFFDRHGNANERMMAHYLQGRVHHDMGEAPIALECYQRATEVADTASKDSITLHTLAAIYGQMADLFHLHFLPNDEMNALRMAEQIAMKNHEAQFAIKTYELRVRPYFLLGKTDSMMYVMREARERYLKVGKTKEAAQAIFPMISIFLDREDLLNARHWLDIYEGQSGNFDQHGELIHGGEYYYDKGRYLFAIGKTDSAKYYFSKARDRGIMEAAYKGLLSVYKRLNEADSTAKFAELFANANDSSYMHVNQEKISQISSLYNYTHQRQVAEQKGQEAKRWETRLSFIILLMLFTISSIAFVFSHFKAQKLKEINTLAKIKDRLEILLDEKEKEIEHIIQENQVHVERVRMEVGDEIGRLNMAFESEMGKVKESDGQEFIESIRQRHEMEIKRLMQKNESTIIELSREKEAEIERIKEDKRLEALRLNNKNARLQRTLKEDVERLSFQVDTLKKKLVEKSASIADEDGHKITITNFKEKFQEYHKGYTAPTEKDWEGLVEAFQAMYTNFFCFITSFPNMKKEHIYVCLMTMLGFSERMMAEALKTDGKQVDRRKRQINKKLFHEDNASSLKVNLLRFL
ncbi:MAG: hypothetical protein IJK87_00280 [Prevotella sp.]|nr:hypothetical protein [Prevotella sp.]